MRAKICASLWIASWAMIIVVVACSHSKSSSPPQVAQLSALPQPYAETTPILSTASPIRLIDFANFTYPWISDLGDPKKPFTLRHGELPPTRNERGLIDEMGISLEKVDYGDVTGDGAEEAIVVLDILTGGSAMPNAIYIYTLKDAEPKLIWSASTDDRADGGLQRVSVENGDLILERYSPIGAEGDCCPTHFTRTHYEWRNNRFKQKGKSEILPIREQSGNPIATPHNSPTLN